MAVNTRQARKEAEYKRNLYFSNYFNRISFLFHNSVEIVNLPNDLPKRYILTVLRTKGAIAYDKETGLYLPFVKKGIDIYGMPQEYSLIGFNGYTVSRKANEVVILRANDLQIPIDEYFEAQCNKLVDYDLAIEQNLDSIKTMTIAEVNDEASLLSLVNEYNARRLGATVVYRNKNAMTGNEIKVSSTGATYLVDKLLEARKEVLNETLSTIGINVANVDKKERVQGEEIRASQGYALDCLSTLIDTFNHDAELGGLPIRFKGNTSLYDANELQKLEIKGEEYEK